MSTAGMAPLGEGVDITTPATHARVRVPRSRRASRLTTPAPNRPGGGLTLRATHRRQVL